MAPVAGGKRAGARPKRRFRPVALIFALAIIPFGSPAVALYLLAFATAVPAMGLLWLAGGRLVGAAVGEKRRLVPRVASVALVGFAGLIAAWAFG